MIDRYLIGGFDTLSFPGLYTTKEGKKLGKQLKNLSEFVFTLTFLTFPVAKIKNAWVALIRRGDIEKFKPLIESEKEFEDFSNFMAGFANLINDKDENDLGVLFGRTGLRRLLALQSLSAYAYVESYGKKLIDIILENKSLEEKVLRFLSENETRNNKDESRVETIKQVKDLGLSQHLDTLEKALDVREICIGFTDEEHYDKYRKLFTYFIRLRGKMAHDNPEPSLSKFDHELFRRARNEVRAAFSIFPELDRIPEILVPHIEIMKSWFRKTSSTLAVIYSVPKMIVAFTSYIDVVVHYYQEEQ